MARAGQINSNSTHLFCFSHLRWSFVFQRPQHLMTRAAREFTTWYFEEPERIEGPPFLRIVTDKSGVSVVTPLLPRHLSPQETNAVLRDMLGNLLAKVQPKRLIAWYYTPMALQFTGELEPDRCVYDNMDELSAFAGAPDGIVDWERKLLSRCDVVYVGGHSLYEAKCDSHENIHVFPSSVDVAHFRKARFSLSAPADQAGIGHPRIGFFGVIDERMNADIVAEIAAIRPSWRLMMIGPTAKIDATKLPHAANIHWLGGKDYAALPQYLAGWDVGFMPFAINEATRYISPTKTPEFLAAGVPVVSTPITDVVHPYGDMGLVEIASTAKEFVERIDYLLRRPRTKWLQSVDAYLSAMSWDDTWAAMRQRLDAFVPARHISAEARRV
jgi:glycosyltransferase involved in cell wall biosynthesis